MILSDRYNHFFLYQDFSLKLRQWVLDGQTKDAYIYLAVGDFDHLLVRMHLLEYELNLGRIHELQA